MKKLQKGFTLIELLVVIAIIGILASIVLASLSTATSKGNDAKIQEQMASVKDAAQIYYSNNNSSFANMCSVGSSDTSGLYALLQPINYPGGTAPTCSADATGFAVYHPNSAATYEYCVDYTGVSATTTTGNPAANKTCGNVTF